MPLNLDKVWRREHYFLFVLIVLYPVCVILKASPLSRVDRNRRRRETTRQVGLQYAFQPLVYIILGAPVYCKVSRSL
jgi:hypothetical protein